MPSHPNLSDCWSFDTQTQRWTFRLHSRDIAGCDPQTVADAIQSHEPPRCPLDARKHIARLFLCLPREAITVIIGTRLANYWLKEQSDDDLATIGLNRSDLDSHDFWDKIERIKWLVRWLVFEVEFTTHAVNGCTRIKTIDPVVAVVDPWDFVWAVGDEYIDAY